jgi:putative oxidoreductase
VIVTSYYDRLSDAGAKLDDHDHGGEHREPDDLPGSSDEYEAATGRKGKLPSHGGADFGLLILRLGLGGVFLLQGAQKLFGLSGGPGHQDFAQMLQEVGFQQSSVLALVAGGTEFGAGVLLVLGLFTPLGAAGVLSEMVIVVLLNSRHGLFASQGGVELEAALGVVALGLMFTGPGRIALDNSRVWYRHPLITGFICLLLALGVTVVVLLGFNPEWIHTVQG